MAKGPQMVTTDFDKKFAEIVNKAVPSLAGQALYQQGFQLIKYAIMEEPRCPHKTGRLWNSQRVDKPKIEPGLISVNAGFDCEYAASVHEAPDNRNWTLAGSGPKYLETKLTRHRTEMMQATADKIKGGAK